MRRTDKDLSQARMESPRSLVTRRKKKEKRAKRLRRYQKLKKFRDISHQGRCQILSKNKPMSRIDLCKLEKML
jgi:hypothetical protein